MGDEQFIVIEYVLSDEFFMEGSNICFILILSQQKTFDRRISYGNSFINSVQTSFNTRQLTSSGLRSRGGATDYYNPCACVLRVNYGPVCAFGVFLSYQLNKCVFEKDH